MANRFFAMALGAFLGVALVIMGYDWFKPLYRDTSLTDIEWRGTLLLGTLTLTKERDCAPVKGSLVGLSHYAEIEREPVPYTDETGKPWVLKDLPASPEPYEIRTGWKLARSLPKPDQVSVTFRAKCGFFTRRYFLGPFDI